ncbi:YedE family putative selenium transporter [uncultured Negativibacillus sp.]|uniref:YedE family putative selenium transporter n=1 Tax=uncultured Negativibacillus sp. TaxID=1980696 RepID=UPI0025F8A5D4|nr:YedE family putative selenium transporter [uncultured Negativibacillus sp.]
MKDKKTYVGIIATGAVIGLIAVALVVLGNPKNMGFCIACFLRDIAGSTKLHTAPIVQYFRPEIVGLVIGAMAMALIGKEFSPKGGSAPVTRFFLGAFVMIGALVFLGCPLRMVLRIGGGDLNAVVGLIGFAAGILVGIFFLNKGFSLKRTYKLPVSEAFVFPAGLVLLFALFLIVPSLFVFSESGPGSMHAPVIIALIAGLVVGALCQKSRMCMVAGIRDLVLFKDWKLLLGFVTIIIAALIGNLVTGNFNLGFAGQPVAHSVHLWNFMGMLIVGFGSVLLGGCPLRQLILTGEGNTDSAVTVLGYIAGAAFAHNFSLAGSAASADSIGGPSINGKVAVIIGLVVMLAIAALNTAKARKDA